MFCKNCGSQLAEGAKFCPNCGTSVDSPAGAPEAAPNGTATGGPTVASVTGAIVSSPAEPALAPTQYAAPESKKMSTGAIIGIVAGAAAILILGGILVANMFSNNGTNGGNAGGNGGNSTADNGGSNSGNSGGNSSVTGSSETAGKFSLTVPSDLRFGYSVDDTDGEVVLSFHLDQDEDMGFYLRVLLDDISDYEDGEYEDFVDMLVSQYGAEKKNVQGVDFMMWTDRRTYSTTLDDRIVEAVYKLSDDWDVEVKLEVDGLDDSYTEGAEMTFFEKYVPTIIKSLKYNG